MPRYEYSEGTSNKFWEIALAGKSFTTKHGKIGSNGQTLRKDFANPLAAQVAHDKIIAEKVKKGYQLVGGKAKPAGKTKAAVAAPPGAKLDARNPALEAAIAANPNDESAWAIFGDWLQEQGDPRGELMSLQMNGQDKAAKKLLAKHADYFLGPLAEHQKVYDEGYNNSHSHLRDKAGEKAWRKTHEQAFLWQHGFIHRVRLSHDEHSSEWEGELVDVLAQVLAHPSARFVVEFAFQSNDEGDNDLQDLIDVLAKKAPPSVRKLTFGDNVDQISWHFTGNLAKLWKGVPNLQILEIETGQFDVGKMHAPALERAVFITGGLSKKCARNIASADIPKIQHLEIYYGDDSYGGECTMKEVKPLLDRTDLKHLTYLGLENALFQNDIAKAIGGAKVIKTLKTLNLSQGTLNDEGAEALAAAKSSLKHLDTLDLSKSFLTKKGIDLVKGICKNVITSEQRKPWDEGEDGLRYYVSIAE